MDILPMSSGEAIIRKGGTLEAKGENEMTLMRLRRLSRTVMSKNERHRFEARKLCRSNIVTFLEGHLMHCCEKVRYLALELFCCTIPRLANKTDCLLRPILPKVFQCLQGSEGRDMKLKALHFLRGYFRHTKSFPSFIDNFVRLGIENADTEVQISCCLGLNIVFDQDIGSSLYSPLVVSVSNLLIQRSQHSLMRAAYRALKHIHKTVGDDRFFDLISLAYPEATEMYKSLFTFEESDSFLATSDVSCSTLVLEYQMKRKHLNLAKDFGILDPALLDQICHTKNCERARILANFAAALKRTPWTADDLDPHILDFLKIVQSFIFDSNRLIQMSGFDILKEVINKTGFTLSPHIRFIVDIVRFSLTSANSKIRSKAEKVVNKLMRNIHPMTVMWELLSTKNPSQKESVLMLVQEKMSCFPYYDLDMVALCNHLGHSLEDKNARLAKSSRDCIILLLDIMRDCPVYGKRTEAVRTLLRNHKFGRETLKDIGVLGNSDDEDDSKGFRSYTDDEMTDSTSIPIGSVSDNTHRSSLSTAGGESRKTPPRREEGSSSVNDLCLTGRRNEIGNEESDFRSQTSCRTPENSEVALSTNDMSKDSFIECSDTSSVREQVLSSEADSVSMKHFKGTFVKEQQLADPDRQHHLCLEAAESPEAETTASGSLVRIQAAVPEASDDFQDQPPSGTNMRKYFTRFCMKTDGNSTANSNNNFQDSEAGGDVEAFARNSSLDLRTKSENKMDSRFIIESYELDGVLVDVMNKNIFNFNILQVDHANGGSTEEFDSAEGKARRTNPGSNKTRISILQKEKHDTPDRASEVQESRVVRKNRTSKATSNDHPQPTDLPCPFSKYDAQTKCQKFLDSNFGANDLETNASESVVRVDRTGTTPTTKEPCQTPLALFSECPSSCEQNLITNESLLSMPDMASDVETVVCCNKEVDEVMETPFLPKSRQLPRTPILKGRDCSPGVLPNFANKGKKSNTRKVEKKKDVGTVAPSNTKEETDGSVRKTTSTLHGTENNRTGYSAKHNISSKWGGCQWRRDLEYAAKAATCPWADKFEKIVHAMKPFPSPEAAESEMKKAVDDLFGNSWKGKEEAMQTVIRLARHHPEVVQENTTKIVVALSNEIKNFRQSVAGKAVLTTGHLYEIMGKTFESKLRIVVAALLAKSGNRTLAAYFRLVIKSLVKITSSTSPHKAALAFIHEGSRHANKAARETAAQFLTILTEHMGPETSLVAPYSSQMLKCAAMFVSDSSALTRYCGKRMFKVFMKNPDFDKLKDHQLDINTAQSLSKILEQIKAKGITEEVLPINIID